jgi:hypothetical protein
MQHFHLKNSPYQLSWQRPQMGSCSKGHKGGFATLAERKSRLYLALPIANKTAQNANDAINKLLTPLKHWVNAIAFSIFLMLMAQVLVKRSAYRFVLQDKAIGGFSANFNLFIIEVGCLIALTLMSAPVLLMLALALATGKLTWLLVKDTKVALPLLP